MLPFVLLPLAIIACGPSDAERAQVASLQSHDSTVTKENTALQAQKDSLLLVTRNFVEAMNSIDSATALAGFKAPKNQKEPIPQYEVQVRDRTLKAIKRLRAVQARLKATLARVDSLGNDNKQLHSEVASLHDAAVAMQTQAATQQARLDSLVQQLAVATARGDSLQGKTKQLSTTIDSMVTENHKVYVVMGTKDYLLKHNLVEEVGGTRFPFIVKIGKTLRPASASPDTSLFKVMDMVSNTDIPLDPSKRYEVVSSQDLSVVDEGRVKGRVVSKSIHVADPQRFWKASPYLILREL